MPDSAATPEAYQMFADVTPLVQAAGAGTYTVANVQTDLGTDRYGAWGLVVVVRDPRPAFRKPMRAVASPATARARRSPASCTTPRNQ